MDFILLSILLPGELPQLVFDKSAASPASVSVQLNTHCKSQQGAGINFKKELPAKIKLSGLKMCVSVKD